MPNSAKTREAKRLLDDGAHSRDLGEVAIERSTAGSLEILADVQDVAELAEIVPFVGPVVRIVKWGLHRGDVYLCAEFLNNLSTLLEVGSTKEAAALVESKLQHRWAQEGVVRGLRRIVDAVAPEARRAIAVLVAEYLRNETMPDLAFKQTAAFLADGDARVLRAALRMLDAIPMSPPDDVARHALVVPDYHGGNRRFRWIPYLHDRSCRDDAEENLSLPSGALRVVTLLVRHGIGHPFDEWASPGVSIDREEDTATVELVRRCIRTANVGQEQGNAETSNR